MESSQARLKLLSILYLRQQSCRPIKQKGQSIDCPKVAGVGLEPHDLRVMSPTSYQLLHPAMYLDLPKRNLLFASAKIVQIFISAKFL